MNIKRVMLELAYLKGKAKKKISPELYESARNKAFEKLEKVI